jgi:hypothetical protein
VKLPARRKQQRLYANPTQPPAKSNQRSAALDRAASVKEPIPDDAGKLDEVGPGPATPGPVSTDDLDRSEDGILDPSISDSDPVDKTMDVGVRMPVSVPVEPGDVLAFDPGHPGMIRPAAIMADTAVVGIAVEPTWPAGDNDGEEVSLQALVALTGLVACKVDAGYGAVRAGDLLTTSPTPGHAMRALEPLPGTILGKAAIPRGAPS